PWRQVLLPTMLHNADVADFHFFLEYNDCLPANGHGGTEIQNMSQEEAPDARGNVFFHWLDRGQIWQTIVRRTEHLLQNTAIKLNQRKLEARPHKLTDFKPFYGSIFMPLLRKMAPEGTMPNYT